MKLLAIGKKLPMLALDFKGRKTWVSTSQKMYDYVKKYFKKDENIIATFSKKEKDGLLVCTSVKKADTLILSKQTKSIFRTIYGKKRFTKSLLEEIENEALDKLYKRCKKAGYIISFDFV